MANTLSNLYVERASSEHPLALWSLNEKVDYISFLIPEQRKLYLFDYWDLVEAEASPYSGTALINTPFLDDQTVKVQVTPPDEDTGTTIMTAKFDVYDQLSDGFGSFAIGSYFYIDSSLISQVSLGYIYTNDEDEDVEVLSTFNVKSSSIEKWTQYLDTFAVPPSGSSNLRLVIKFTSVKGGLEDDYDVYVNGLSAGHWAEDFMSESFGVTLSTMPVDIALPESLSVINAFPYGASGENGYYIASQGRLRCKNFGVPLVYGSSEVTKIYPNNVAGIDYPSLIFPGYGFLNQRGKNNDYTIEMWLRINAATATSRRIFGPINSEDGLYVDDSFITLKIGKSYGSHFVGEWYRPMLIHVRLVQGSAVVLINGESVIEFEVDLDNTDFPEEVLSDKNQDWLGFYAYQDVPLMDLDSFSIYSYGIPTQVAKRRFVWGQAVTPPEQTNSAINAVTAFNDYSFANYAANYNYPDFANWRQAFFSNLNADARSLKLPDYDLPNFILDGRNIQEFFDEMQAIEQTEDPDDVAGRKYFTFGLNESNSEHFYFRNLNILNDRLSSLYGVFKTDGTAVNEPIIKITNKNTDDYILVSLNGLSLSYIANINNVRTTIATKTIEADVKFTAGLNLLSLSQQQISGINRFFTDTSSLDLYLCGDSAKKFNGRMYKFGFDGPYNNRKITDYYSTSGVFLEDEETAEVMYLHTANYTLVPINKYGVFFADIAVAGYWEDYVPLSYFAKYVLDNNGNKIYDLDFLQFNIDFPEPNAVNVVEETSFWTYGDLRAQYSSPQLLLYRDLNNKFYTKWEDYQDMNENSIKTIFFNTEKSTVRSYISFQEIIDGANKNLSDFANIASPLASEIVDPDGRSFDWRDTAYEITTGSIIYPPKTISQTVDGTTQSRNIDFNALGIVYHIDFKSEGLLHQPINVKELQLASQVFERTRLTPVGSKFGIPVFYYSKPGFYFDLKGKNPVATYKKSTPHLYLNRQSGWKLRGDFDINTDRGLAMPINQSAALDTEVSSVQLWVRFSDKEFPGERVKIFSIAHNDGTYDFYMQGDPSQQRAEIFGIDKETDLPLENIKYFINGNTVIKPYIVKEEWAVIAIEFPDLLNFSGRSGIFYLNGPLIYNNISYNLATNLERNEVIEPRTWSDLLTVRQANISGATTEDGLTTYTVNKSFRIGELVTVTGVFPEEYNIENAEILDVTVGETISTFTIAKDTTEPYSLGGIAIASAWDYTTTDLEVNDNSSSPYKWQQVRVFSQSRSFNIDPEKIYKKYTGSDRIIIDDESRGLLVRPDQFTVYNNVVWRETTKLPV